MDRLLCLYTHMYKQIFEDKTYAGSSKVTKLKILVLKSFRLNDYKITVYKHIAENTAVNNNYCHYNHL